MSVQNKDKSVGDHKYSIILMSQSELKFLLGWRDYSGCLDYSGQQLKTQAHTQTQAHTGFEKLNHFEKHVT